MNIQIFIVLTIISISSMVQAFDLNRLESLHRQATEIIHQSKSGIESPAANRHFSKCLRFFQKSKSTNFDLCRQIDQSVRRYNNRRSERNNEKQLKQYLRWSKYHF